MIKYYDLTGFHYRAEKKILNELNQIYKKKFDSRSINVPWYLIISDTGQIIDYDAPKPSEIIELEKRFHEI